MYKDFHTRHIHLIIYRLTFVVAAVMTLAVVACRDGKSTLTVNHVVSTQAARYVNTLDADAPTLALAMLYERQEKDREIMRKDEQLENQAVMIVVSAIIIALAICSITVMTIYSRKLKQHNQAIVATINQLMEQQGELARLRMEKRDGKAKVDPEEMRMAHAVEMLRDDRRIEDIVRDGGFDSTEAFTRKFYRRFGISPISYRKWAMKVGTANSEETEDRADRAKETFLKNVSHELRTPLNQIFGFVQLLTDPDVELGKEEKKEYNNIIKEQTKHMTAMLSKFLEISEYENSDALLTMETVNIRELMEQTMESLPKPKPGVEVTFRNNSGEETVVSNKRGLMRIIQCLMGNAQKFTDEGYIAIECTKRKQGNIVFSVTDTGRGISEEQKGHIFERFYKGDNFVPGTGLGLPLAREIAKRMKADITLDETYRAKGARFVLVLPT